MKSGKLYHTNVYIFCRISIDGAEEPINISDLIRDRRLGKFSKQVKVKLICRALIGNKLPIFKPAKIL